jgi:GNAT superfamily N-acetyltransferase
MKHAEQTILLIYIFCLFVGSTRLQIEAVRVATHYRGQKIGEWMMNAVFDYAKANGASIIQLTTNKQRPKAKLEATHEGMKYYF